MRAEFFDGCEQASTSAAPYLMDFTYLYGRNQADFINFMAGVRVSDNAGVSRDGAAGDLEYARGRTEEAAPDGRAACGDECHAEEVLRLADPAFADR